MNTRAQLARERARARMRMSKTPTPERRVALRLIRNERTVLTPLSSVSVASHLRALMHSPSDKFTRHVLAKLRVAGYDVHIPGVDPKPPAKRRVGQNLSKRWEVR